MSFDLSGAITFVNKWHLSAFARNKYSAEHFLGMKISDLPGVISTGIADEINNILKGESLTMEDVYVSKFSGGQSGYVNIRGVLIVDEGKIVGGVLIREDITARKLAELALKKSLDKHTALLQSLPAGVISVDSDFRITEINHQGQEIIGYGQVEALGRFCGDVLQADTCESTCPIKTAVRNHGTVGPIDTTVLSKQRGRLPVQLWAAGLYDAHNNQVGGVEVFQDVSEIKALERERANIVSMFAHDMKFPLVGIQGFALRMLKQKGEGTPERKRKYLEIIRKEAGRLEAIINDFLDIARLETGHLKLNLSATDIDKGILELLETFQLRFAQAGITMEMENSSKLPVIEADATHLRRALGNLLENAIKYSHSGTKVTMTAFETEKELVIKLKDQGIGIAPEELPHIFDIFYRGRDQKKRNGHGLGLAGVEAIVKAHGGRVMVSSELGKGSVFTVTLPLNKQAEAS